MKTLLLLLAVFTLPLIFSACKDDNEIPANPVELTVDQTELAIAQNDSRTVNITTGNGKYVVTSSNEKVVTATIDDSNAITVTAQPTDNNAEAMIVITDQCFKRAYIKVTTSKIFEMRLDKSFATLYAEVKGDDEATIRIVTGNGGYKAELLDDSKDFIELHAEDIETTEKFMVKGLNTGTAKVKVSDSQGKSAVIVLTIVAPTRITTDKQAVILKAAQGSDIIGILTGNGKYVVTVEDPAIIKASIDNDKIHVTGKKNGTTTLSIKDAKGQSFGPIPVTVDGPRYAMNLGETYFCYANFGDIANVDNSISSCKQITFETLCKLESCGWLQTFMGLESYLIMRGAPDDNTTEHPVQIAGLNDNIVMESVGKIKANEWLHLALVVDCTKGTAEEIYTLYINGEKEPLKFTTNREVHQSVDLTSSRDGGRFEIGRASNDDRRSLKGSVSETRVWTVARTAEQVAANMYTLKETNPQGLLARWDFTAGVETNYVQDINGGKYETNLTISTVKPSDGYVPTNFPMDRYVEKDHKNE